MLRKMSRSKTVYRSKCGGYKRHFKLKICEHLIGISELTGKR